MKAAVVSVWDFRERLSNQVQVEKAKLVPPPPFFGVGECWGKGA